jgi:Tfp pilus assembly protein PilE
VDRNFESLRLTRLRGENPNRKQLSIPFQSGKVFAEIKRASVLQASPRDSGSALEECGTSNYRCSSSRQAAS